ncbi:MAG: hypothetical protein MZV64_63095 [Ignavibacteriales bacterium]|nr:hypothetical protein [Ignavibacteriales bacterium]
MTPPSSTISCSIRSISTSPTGSRRPGRPAGRCSRSAAARAGSCCLPGAPARTSTASMPARP